jgi:hypothetical protein
MKQRPAVPYILHSSGLKSKEPLFVAKPLSTGKLAEKEFLKTTQQYAGSLPVPVLQQALGLVETALLESLLTGRRVQTSLFSASIKLPGGLKKGEVPDPSLVEINIRPSAKLLENLRSQIVLKKAKTGRAPELDSIRNCMSEKPGILTPGGMFVLDGSDMSFESSDEKQGVFIYHKKTKASYRISVYGTITPSSITAQFPLSLPPGEYSLALCLNLPQKQSAQIFLSSRLKVE